MAKRKTRIEPITDHLTVVEFLGDILEGARENAINIDHQINILIGFCVAIFLFAVSELKHNAYELSFLIMAVMAAVASLIALLAVHPPRFSRKRGQAESFIYNKEITSLRRGPEYVQKLRDILGHRGRVEEQYGLEIYNLYRYYYRPKRRMFHWARNMLLGGLGLSLVSFIVTWLLASATLS